MKKLIAVVVLLVLSVLVFAQDPLTTDLRQYNGHHWDLMTQPEKHRFTEGFLLGLWVILEPINIQDYMKPNDDGYLYQIAAPLDWASGELTQALDQYYQRHSRDTPIWQVIYEITLKELP